MSRSLRSLGGSDNRDAGLSVTPPRLFSPHLQKAFLDKQ
jgi:hypothetical protein